MERIRTVYECITCKYMYIYIYTTNSQISSRKSDNNILIIDDEYIIVSI